MTTELYNACIEYAKMLVRVHKSRMNHLDIVHDVILIDGISFNNYKRTIKDYFHSQLSEKSKWLEFNEIGVAETGKELIPCKNCKESLPQDCFRTRRRSGGTPELFTTYCKKCEVIKAKKRIKKYAEKQKKELGDWYIKRLLTRHKYKKNEVTPELIESKRQEILDLRKNGNWRTKKHLR